MSTLPEFLLWLSGLFPASTTIRDWERHNKKRLGMGARTVATIFWPAFGLVMLPMWLWFAKHGDDQ